MAKSTLGASETTLTLLTALPGSGKSLRMVQAIAQDIAAGKTVYVMREASGRMSINGIKLPVLPWDDITDWKNIPAGSVLYIDEAQKWFPARRSGDPPQWMRDLSELRHHGLRFVVATQRPSYLDTYIRGLAGPHEHMIRVNGQEGATIYRHQKLIADVDSEKLLAQHDFEYWPYPKEHYADYDSAEVHTVKRTFRSSSKRRVKLMATAAVLFLAIVAVAWKFGRDEVPASVAKDPPPDASTSFASPSGTRPASSSYGTSGDYLASRTPLIPTIPSSAPIFQGREVVAEPRIFCMSSSAGLDGSGKSTAASCTCLTEQGTAWPLDHQSCEYIARHGPPYDPHLRPASAVAAAPAVSDVPVSPGVSETSQAVQRDTVIADAGIGSGWGLK